MRENIQARSSTDNMQLNRSSSAPAQEFNTHFKRHDQNSPTTSQASSTRGFLRARSR